MNIDKLTQGDLLKIRDNINSRLEYINELKELKKSSKDKNALSDLDKTDKIFSINFYGSKLYQMDYVKISFNEISYCNNLSICLESTHKNEFLNANIGKNT